MDIPALSSAMSQAQLFHEVSASVASLQMDRVENSTEQFMDLLESATLDRQELENSVQTHLGNNLDLFI